MTQYRDQPFGVRLGKLGDEAEAVYEAAHPIGPSARLGWNRPNIKMQTMPGLFRHMPDYYAEVGALVEVVGCGRDSILKAIKPDKYEALKQWARLCKREGLDLYLFVWNSHMERYALIEWSGLVHLVRNAKRRGIEQFSDGNAYYPIPWDDVIECAGMVGAWSTQ